MAPNPTAGRKKKPSREVIETFRRFNLPVTDNTQRIEKSYNDQKEYNQDLGNSPNPLDILAAREWDQAAVKLRDNQQRAELLQIVYRDFTELADVSVKALLSTGQNTITQELANNFLVIAESQLECDPDLALTFRDRYLREHRWEIETGPIIDPQPVISPQVVADTKGVHLSWTRPATGCESVKIVRYVVENNRPSKKNPPSWNVTDTKFDDGNNLVPGTRYRYELISVALGHELHNPPFVEAVAISEVNDFHAAWDGHHVVLRWQPLPTSGRVYLFRATSTIDLKPNSTRPQAASAAEMIYEGTDTEHTDTKVVFGQKYYYRAVAFFGAGAYSPGVQEDVSIPVPPPAVKQITFSYANGTATLNWDEVKHSHKVDYMVRQTEGRTPAASPQRGRKVADTQKHTCQDSNINNGHRYTYTVFSSSQDLSSAGCSTRQPLTRADGVTDFITESTDQAVMLCWQKPPEAREVIIRRSLRQGISYPDDGTVVLIAGEGRAHDTGLDNGETYYYTAWCVYEIDGEVVLSEGKEQSGTPQPPPGISASFQFKLKPGDNQVIFSWTLTGEGRGFVARSHRLLDYAANSVYPDTDLRRFNENNEEFKRLKAVGTDHAIDTDPNPKYSVYTLIIASGRQARIGPYTQCVIAVDPTQLEVVREDRGIVLRWEWPRYCESVLIARHPNKLPLDLNDPQATVIACSRRDYDNNRGCYLDREAGPGQVFYVVRAQMVGALETVISPGTSPDCQVEVSPGRVGTLRFKHRIDKRGLRRRPVFVFDWHFQDLPDHFDGFALVVNRRSIPTTIDDGRLIYEWRPSDSYDLPAAPQTIEIPLDDDTDQWVGNHFYYNMFLINPANHSQVAILPPRLQDGVFVR